MSAGLRAWVASHAETRWAVAVAILCVALVGASLFWPEGQTRQASEEESAPVRMSVETPPASPEPAPEAEAAKPVKNNIPDTPKAGEATAPLPTTQSKETEPATTSQTTTPAATSRGYFVQVGAFRDRNHAETLKKRLENHHWPVRIQLKKGKMYAVWVGGYTNKADAEKAKTRLTDQEKLPGFLTSR